MQNSDHCGETRGPEEEQAKRHTTVNQAKTYDMNNQYIWASYCAA